MNLKIEQQPTNAHWPAIKAEWQTIQECITGNEFMPPCTSKDRLRTRMNTMVFTQFIYGFGHSHMWVKHKYDSDRRLLIVEFEEEEC